MFDTSNFGAAIEEVRERYFLLEEFPFLERRRLPEGILEKAMTVREEDLESYSYSLSGKEVEAILLDIPALKTLETQERAAAILNIRFSPRLIKLFFVLYQTYYDIDAIRLVKRKLIREAKRRAEFPKAGAFFWDFDGSNDLFEEVKLAFTDQWKSLDNFFLAYQIRQDTRLAMEIRLRCLEDAELPLIHSNLHHFMILLERKPEKHLLTAITNYIYLSDLKNAINEVYLLILERMGEPSRSRKWEIYDRKVAEKFSEWCFYHHLTLHSKFYPKKYEILSHYYDHVEQSYELEGSALVLDFGEIVVVDIPNHPFSFFYYKWEFERQMKEWEEAEAKPAFYLKNPEQISARDFIIEDKDAPYILLRYEGVDLLYIQEILNIQIGLVPDFRHIKLNAQNKLEIKLD